MNRDILLIGTEVRLPLFQESYDDEKFEFRVASTLHKTLEAIKEKLPNLILIDHESAKNQSIEILQTLKKYPGTQRIPIIFIIPRTNLDILLEALYIPADDYIFLPLDTDDFKMRVNIQCRFLDYKENKKLMSVDEKIEELEKLLKIFPDYNAARQELSAIYEKTGKIEKALDANLELAKQYCYQSNFGQATEIISKMKNIISKQSRTINNQSQFLETLERGSQLLNVKK